MSLYELCKYQQIRYVQICWYFLSFHRKALLPKMVVMSLHHVTNLSFGFDLFMAIQVSFLLGWERQEISGCTVWLPVIIKEVKDTLDVWNLLGIKTSFVIIPCKADDAVYRLAENIAYFEQQETETADNIVLPYNPVFKPVVSWACSVSLRVQFGLMLSELID